MKKSNSNAASGTVAGLKDSQLEDIFENALECISRIDRQGNYLSVNSRYAETCGYTVDEMNGMGWEETVLPDDLDTARQAYQEMMDAGRSELEIRGTKKDGDVFDMHIVMVRGLDTSDSSVGHYCFMQDITAKRLAEQQALLDAHKHAHVSEQKFTRVLSSSLDAIIIFQCDGNTVTDINDAALNLSGYRARDILGHDLMELNLLADPDHPAAFDETILDSCELNDRDALLRQAGGKLVPVSISRLGLSLNGKQHCLLIARDLSDRKSRENAYQQAMEAVSSISSEQFFTKAMQLLAESLKVKHALITERVAGTPVTVRTLAFYRDGGLVENVQYPLQGTPCADVLQGKSVYFPDRVQDYYPQDAWLADEKIQAYLAEPLLDSDRRVIGHLVIQDTRPVAYGDHTRAMLRVFSARAAAELERTRILRDLKASEERLQQVAVSSQSVIWELDSNMIHTYVSPASMEVFSTRPESMVGTSVLDYIYPYDKKEFLEQLNHYIDAGQPFNYLPVRMFHKDGHVLHLNVSGIPIYDESGELQAIRGSTNDITQQVLAHRELLDIGQQTRLILEQALDAYIVIDEVGIVTQWNRQAESLFGWSTEEAIGRCLTDLIIPFDKHTAHLNGIRKFLKTGESNLLDQHLRLTARHRYGYPIPLELTVTRIETSDGFMFSAFLRDLSDEVQQERIGQAKLRILDQIARGQAFNDLLDFICREVGSLYDDKVQVSITEASAGTLRLLAAPGHNEVFCRAINGMRIAEDVGIPCGVAACIGKPVYADDIEHDPVCSGFQAIARDNCIKACWSMPFLDQQGQVMGCLTLCLATVGQPGTFDHKVLDEARYLVSIVLERERRRREYSELQNNYSKAIDICPDGIAITRLSDGKFLEVNEAFCLMTGRSREELLGISVGEIMYESPLQRAKMIEDIKRKGSIRDLESRISNEKGKLIYWLQSSALMELNGESCLFSVGHIITRRKQQDLLRITRNRVLEAITTNQPFQSVLEIIARSSEEIDPDMLCSVLLLDPTCRYLTEGASPSLPDFYNRAIDGIEIGEGVGSCGTAAFTGQRVIVTDIQTHPYWRDYRDLARRAGIGACWSQPIFSSDEKILGTFAIYYAESREPDDFEIEYIQSQACLASIAIERDRSLQALRAREETLSKYFNTATESIVVARFDDGVLLNVNNGFERITGYSRAEVVGKSSIEMGLWIHPEQRESMKQILGSEGIMNNLECEFRARDGHIITVLMSASIIEMDGEKCVMSSSRDITEWRATEAALEKSEQRLHQFTMTSPDPIFLTRVDDGRIIEVNESFEANTGFSMEEVIGRTSVELGLWPQEEDRQRYIDILKRDGKVQNLEIVYRKKDNRLSHALISATANMIDGELYAFNLARDIEERKQEQQLLENINEALLNLGHDINENIQRIVATVGQLLRGRVALFNRLEVGNRLHAVGKWNLSDNDKMPDLAEGSVCYDLIKSGNKAVRVVSDFHKSCYVTNNPGLRNTPIRTYVGQNVFVDGQAVGTLCVFYDHDYIPGEVDKEVLGILVSALGREEARRLSDRTLVNITRGVSVSTGETFFEYLTNYLCISMEADFALVGCLSEDRRSVHTLAVSSKGETVDNLTYELENSPCKVVISGDGKLCMYPRGIRQRFPEDTLLRKMEIESYVGTPLRNSRGKVIGLIVVFFKQAIHKERYFLEQPLVIFAARAESELERMSSVQALIKSEEKFRDAFGKAPTGICLIDREGTLFQTNRTMLDIIGCTEDAFLSNNLFNIIHPETRDACREEFRRLFQGQISELTYEERLLSPGGVTIWVELHASTVFDDNGLFMFAVTHVIDTTARVLATNRFERSKRALHVLNDCNHGFARIDHEYNLLQYICEVIVSTGKYRMAWVGYCQNDEKRAVKPVAYAGNEDGYLQQLITWADEPHGRGPAGSCIRSLQPSIVRKTGTEPAFAPWRDAALERGYLSCAGFPIMANGVVLGCLLLYAGEEDAFKAEEVSLLQDLTANLARGIQNIRVKVDHDRARHELENSEEKFRMAFSNASMGMAIVNRDGVVLDANESAHHMIGYDANELIGRKIRDITHPDDLAFSLEKFGKLWTGELDQYQIQTRYIRKNGHIIYTILNASIMKDPDGSPEYMVAMVEDITLRREAELALVESEERFRTLYDDTPSMFFTVDSQGRIQSVNEFGARELGYTVTELYREPVEKLVHPDDQERVREHLAKSLELPDRIHRLEFRKIKKDGSIIWVRETLRTILDQEGGRELLVVCEDISEIKRLSSQLSWQASHDALTGLVNRVEFERRLDRVLQSVDINKDEHALCFLDMDQFKVINDSCGHLAGDELLRQLSEVLGAGVRKRDTIARLGGDEFGILMEHCSMDKARQVANAILKKVEDFRFMWEGKRFSLGVSIGLVPINGEINTVTNIMKEADAACYAAKDAGRNRVHVYQSDDKSLSRIRGEMQWVSIINEALEDDKLLLYKQDIKPLFKTSAAGKHYEILIRLQANDGHIVLPGAFMPSAERYNLTSKIDTWVIQNTLKWLQENPDELQALSMCSINLSGLSLSSAKFTDQALDLFKRHAITGTKICFEITETAAIQNMSNAIKFMQMLKEIGCSFALDDFGSGVSSFAYLKQIPVDFIKIDGTFVRDMLTDQVDFEMVRSINDIARVMGIQTIAEFVESEEILRLLQGLGVTYGQGYYIDKPALLLTPDS